MKRAVVVGAGIGGLATAAGLLRAGWQVRVLEQARELREVGAGLTLSSGAQHSLAWLGLGPAVEELIERGPGFPFLHHRTGAVLATNHSGAGHLLRAELHALLAAAVRKLDPDALMLGQRVVAVSPADGQVRTADDLHLSGDLVVGADGVRSAVRAALFGDDEPRFTGRVAYRFLMPAEDAKPFLGAGPAAVYVGRGQTVNRYLVSGGSVLNVVALCATPHWAAEGWSHTAAPAELLAELDGWHPDMTGLVAAAPSLTRWGIFDRPPRTSWSAGRVVLLGDAAHPMLPFLGLGAAMALEDAAVLTRACVECPDPVAAYEKVRIPRTTKVFHASRQQAEILDVTDPDHYGTAASPAHDRELPNFRPAEVIWA